MAGSGAKSRVFGRPGLEVSLAGINPSTENYDFWRYGEVREGGWPALCADL